MLMCFSCEQQGQLPLKGRLYLEAGDSDKNEMAGGWEEEGERDLNIFMKHSELAVISPASPPLTPPHFRAGGRACMHTHLAGYGATFPVNTVICPEKYLGHLY